MEIKFDAGFFNTKYLNSNPDGSFEIELDTFNQIVLSAYDQQIDRGDTITLQYNVDTTLSGNVRDNNDQPLPGATVRIVGTDLQVITDGTGSFKIPNPATGDQIIQIDGTTIPENISCPTRQFSVTNIAVSIGSTQLNVLERPIYLAPKLLTELKRPFQMKTRLSLFHLPMLRVSS